MFEFLVTTFDYNWNVFEFIGIWELHVFCNVYFKAGCHVYHMSISKSKGKRLCSNQPLVNINEGSAWNLMSSLLTVC